MPLGGMHKAETGHMPTPIGDKDTQALTGFPGSTPGLRIPGSSYTHLRCRFSCEGKDENPSQRIPSPTAASILSGRGTLGFP